MKAEQPAPGLFFDGRYVVRRILGSGGIGHVYEVEDTATGHRRALKLWQAELADPTIAHRFRREVLILSRLRSENVVQVVEAGVQNGRPYIVMELLEGEGLDAYLARVSRLPFEEAGAILKQLARALMEAHGNGIVHRDLKPSNVFLTQTEVGERRAKLLDFGLAIMAAGGTNMRTTSLVGTPIYMAPEQISRGAAITPATDLYALGLIAYELLLGEKYRRGNTVAEVFKEVMSSSLDPLPSGRAAELGLALPTAFDGWMQRAIAPAPSARWQNALEMVDELFHALGIPSRDTPESTGHASATWVPWRLGTRPIEKAARPAIDVEDSRGTTTAHSTLSRLKAACRRRVPQTDCGCDRGRPIRLISA